MAVLRPAREEDARAIADIHVRTWQTAYRGLLPDDLLDGLSVERREQVWRDLLAHGDQDVVVADEDGGIVGFASSGPSREAPAEGELYAIYVTPEAWGTGAGRMLLSAAAAALAARGYDSALLWVLEDNARARRFYERAGWLEDGRKLETLGGVEVAETRYRLSGLTGL